MLRQDFSCVICLHKGNFIEFTEKNLTKVFCLLRSHVRVLNWSISCTPMYLGSVFKCISNLSPGFGGFYQSCTLSLLFVLIFRPGPCVHQQQQQSSRTPGPRCRGFQQQLQPAATAAADIPGAATAAAARKRWWLPSDHPAGIGRAATAPPAGTPGGESTVWQQPVS
jgi:hypothetical protein